MSSKEDFCNSRQGNEMIKRLFLIFISLQSIQGAFGKSELSDRLVLELDGRFFSQRNMESYMLVKSAMEHMRSKKAIVPVGDSNWATLKNEFELDMLILAEAKRLGSYSAPKEQIQRQLGMLVNKVKSNEVFLRNMKHLELDLQETLIYVDELLTVSAYRQAKSFSISDDVSDDFSTNSAWLSRLREKYFYRWLEGAGKYEMIKPRRVL